MANDNISLKFSTNLLRIFLRNIRLIGIASIIYGFSILTIVLFYYYNYPIRVKARTDFVINGLVNNKFSNGVVFNPNEIITPEVLKKVYNNDSLETYFKNFSTFSNSVSVTKDTDALQFLINEYNTKLTLDELSPTAKLGLEKEFIYKKEGLIQAANFVLLMNTKDARHGLSNDMLLKIMADILKEWMNISAENKRVTGHIIAPLTRSSLDYQKTVRRNCFLTLDIIRLFIEEIAADIEILHNYPNANSIFVQYKGKVFTLSDINLKYNYIKRCEFDPLLELMHECLFTCSDAFPKGYINFKIKRIDDELAALEEEKYSKSNDKDVDITLASKIAKLKREEKFFKHIKKAFNDKTPPASRHEAEQSVKQQTEIVINSCYDLIDLIQTFVDTLSKHNTQRRDLYSIVSAYASTNRGVSLAGLAFIGLIAWLVAIALTVQVIFIAKYFLPALKNNK